MGFEADVNMNINVSQSSEDSEITSSLPQVGRIDTTGDDSSAGGPTDATNINLNDGIVHLAVGSWLRFIPPSISLLDFDLLMEDRITEQTKLESYPGCKVIAQFYVYYIGSLSQKPSSTWFLCLTLKSITS